MVYFNPLRNEADFSFCFFFINKENLVDFG